MPPMDMGKSKIAEEQFNLDNVLLKIRHLAKHHLTQAAGSHDWDHTLRVHRLCLKIGPAENADMLVLQAAAFDLNYRHASVWVRLQHHLTLQNVKQLCTIRTCKIWMGLPEIDNVDESPRFPYYYVVAHFVVHLGFFFTFFVFTY